MTWRQTGMWPIDREGGTACSRQSETIAVVGRLHFHLIAESVDCILSWLHFELIAFWVDCILSWLPSKLIAIQVSSSLASLLLRASVRAIYYEILDTALIVTVIDLKFHKQCVHHFVPFNPMYVYGALYSHFQMRSVQSLLQHLPTGSGDFKLCHCHSNLT